MRITQSLFLASSLALASTSAQAGWQDWLESIFGGDNPPAEAVLSELSESKIIDGLRESLAVGTERTISELGKPGGFMSNDLVHISLPAELTSLIKPLEGLGQGHLVEQFEGALNAAAEKAVPHVAVIFGDAIRDLTLVDARAILNGEDDAATRFFERTTSESLSAKIRPLITQATDEVGLTSQYKALQGVLGPLVRIFKPEQVDLDEYVTQRALKGLFTQLAEEEKAIRNDPESRTSAILRQIFL